jgi:S-methylmethionine-dependent homocysteine/selenocysteine methylase
VRGYLPQLDGRPFLTDGGLETVLVFHEGIELPAFAAFTLLADDAGTEMLRRYYTPYVKEAASRRLGFIAETPTWRASPRWARELGYDLDTLDGFNRRAVALLEPLRMTHSPVVISGCVGPSDDGYNPSELLSADAAEDYHRTQIATFADTTADMLTAVTMTYPEEAIGITRAARRAGLPVAISFTVETDGRLPSGQTLAEALAQVDGETDAYAAYYMINCAHPAHFEAALDDDLVRSRVRGVRPNASMLSHAELDEAPGLDEGDPADLAARCARLTTSLPNLTVFGGCCGTDHRHVSAIATAVSAP